MKDVRTLNPYIHLLKPKQQEYLVYCVKQHGNLSDFHRGKLPFLNVQTAANCLKLQLELMGQGLVGLPNGIMPYATGGKFIRSILSVFDEALPHKLSEDEGSEIIFLQDKLLRGQFGRRFNHKFCITLRAWQTSQLVQLERIKADYWRVTTSKRQLKYALQHLSDNYNY